MKITFSEQAIAEIERKQADRNRGARGRGAEAVGQTFYGAALGRRQDDIPGAGGEKAKSLIELQQEASNADVGVQRDFMTVMSHTMSAEDYAKMQEEGFDPGDMDPEDVVTIVDKIKAELVRSGKNIVGYTDDLSMETLSAALGSEGLARVVADSFRAADVAPAAISSTTGWRRRSGTSIWRRAAVPAGALGALSSTRRTYMDIIPRAPGGVREKDFRSRSTRS